MESLTKKQLDLGGKYFSLSNSGIDMREEFLQDEFGLNSLYYQISEEGGEDDNGFDMEAKAWRDKLKKEKVFVDRLKEVLPWLFK
jgi:hypothetical protein